MPSLNNIGELIAKSVQEAVDSHDFSKLQSNIEQSVEKAAKGIGASVAQVQNGIAQAHDEYTREQERRRQEQERRQREREEKKIYSGTAWMTVSGILVALLGGSFLVPSFFCTLALVFTGGFAEAAFLGICAVIGAAILAIGVGRISLARLYKDYRRIIGSRSSCTVAELASATTDRPEKALKKIRKMLATRLFKQGSLDEEQSTLFLTDAARKSYEQLRQERLVKAQQAEQERREAEAAERARREAEAAEPTPDSGIDSRTRELLDRGKAYVVQIRRLNDDIPGAEISAKIERVECVADRILARACQHPELVDDLGQLMEYYLPTTVKLLDAYRDLDAQPVQGENIAKSKREIEGALDSLSAGLEKLLDSLFRDMAWDVSADVSVLRTVLAQEGLTDSPFSVQGDAHES